MPRHVLVTGCSSGLGAATATLLAAEGWRVIATARRDEDLARLEAEGHAAVHLELTQSDSVEAAARRVLELGEGQLDGLVHNAGYSQLGAVEDLTRGELEHQFQTNVFGAIELTGALLPALAAADPGRVVFVSSVCARVSLPYLGAYSASKAALEALVDALRRESRDLPVHFHVLEPGIFNTGCFAATSGHYQRVSRSRSSRHAERCEQVLAGFEQELAGIPAERNLLVARAVSDYLTGRRESARRIVPRRAAVYELARRFLPDRILDPLIARTRGGRS